MNQHVKIRLPKPIVCPVCGSTHVVLASNSVLYGKEYGAWPLVYFCRYCRAGVGCHPNTDWPLGTMADKATRAARKEAHLAFDPLWKSGRLGRGQAYAWLAESLHINLADCHISWFDKETCEKVVSVCHRYKKAPNEVTYPQQQKPKPKGVKRKGYRHKRHSPFP